MRTELSWTLFSKKLLYLGKYSWGSKAQIQRYCDRHRKWPLPR